MAFTQRFNKNKRHFKHNQKNKKKGGYKTPIKLFSAFEQERVVKRVGRALKSMLLFNRILKGHKVVNKVAVVRNKRKVADKKVANVKALVAVSKKSGVLRATRKYAHNKVYNNSKHVLLQRMKNNLVTAKGDLPKPLHKVSLKLYDKVFFYYTLQTPLTMYAHKAFVLLEMQLNTSLVRAKLVPYLFMVRDLCFYRLVHLNQLVAKNPHQVVSLYDSLSLPVYLHNYMYYRQYRIQYYPVNVGKFFKNYWAHFSNYTNNKV